MSGLKFVDASEVTNEDLALINAVVASDDEIGEDDEPIELLPQLEGTVGPPATNLTAGNLFKSPEHGAARTKALGKPSTGVHS
jgi:hypothetical protein